MPEIPYHLMKKAVDRAYLVGVALGIAVGFTAAIWLWH